MKIDKDTILSKKVATIISANGYTNNDNKHGKFIGSNISLYDAIYTMPLKWKEQLEYVAKLPYHSTEQKEYKNLIPRYYISGTYNMDEYITRFPIHDYPIVASNLMTIDIDAKDNDGIDIWEIMNEIYKLPYVFACLKSISNMGFYCIIPIADTIYTKEYYTYICKLWKYKFDINIDMNAASLVRARIISYNEDLNDWMKESTSVWEARMLEQPQEPKQEHGLFDYKPKNVNYDNSNWNEILHSAMRKIINDGYYVDNYYAWYYLGCECANFDDGKEMFFMASNNYPHSKDTHSDIEKRWKGCKASGIDDELIRKWCGMAKKRYGNEWMKKI